MRLILIAMSFATMSISLPAFSQSHEAMHNLLREGNTKLLEKELAKVQLKYDSGDITDFQLRNVYRQFYHLDGTDLKNLNDWIKSKPNSYPAHLIRGVYYKKLGWNARGNKYINETKQWQIQSMNSYFSKAQQDLNKSMKLTDKPLLSIFHLLDICGAKGDESCKSRLISIADRDMPANVLLTCRYFHYLTPRWGGSYERMATFIDKTDKQLSDPIMHARLEAIMEDDMGGVSLSYGQREEAITHYKRALSLANNIGGSFREDWLTFTKHAVRTMPELSKFREIK